MNSPKTTLWGGLAAAALAVAATTAQSDPVIAKWAGIVGAVALALKSFFTQDKDGGDSSPGASRVLEGRAPLLLLLCGLLTVGSGCQSLRDKWDGLSPATQSALESAAKEAARVALNLGLSQLGDSVKELRPYTQQLQPLFQATFAQPASDPEKIGAALRAHVAAVVPAESQAAVTAALKDALRDKTPAAAPGLPAYRAALAAQL